MKHILISILCLLLVDCSGATNFQPVKVEGVAMEPQLKDGDRILIDRKLEKLERGDIVVFYSPDNQAKSFIKRIIGLPDETVEVRRGVVFINGKALAEPYVETKNNRTPVTLEQIRIPQDAYYVVGDNRDNSNDSRMWGALPRKFIYGKFERLLLASSNLN